MILLPTDYLLCSLIWEETMENKNKILLLEFIEDVKSHTNKKNILIRSIFKEQKSTKTEFARHLKKWINSRKWEPGVKNKERR